MKQEERADSRFSSASTHVDGAALSGESEGLRGHGLGGQGRFAGSTRAPAARGLTLSRLLVDMVGQTHRGGGCADVGKAEARHDIAEGLVLWNVPRMARLARVSREA